MPLFSDYSNYYYGGTPSSSYSNSSPYTSYIGSGLPHGSSYSSSYLGSGGSYSSHSSLGGYSRPFTPRWSPSSGRTYSPMLTTITERGTSSPIRISSPRRLPITKSYVTSGYTSRPININTADIDVSRDRYRPKGKVSPTSTITPVYTKDSTPTRAHDSGPYMPRVDGKPETGIDSSPGHQRSTIKRGRTVVRLHTIKRKERDSPRKPQDQLPQEKVESSTQSTLSNNETSSGWRDKLSEDLQYKDKREKKTLGAKLIEKFKIDDKTENTLAVPTKLKNNEKLTLDLVEGDKTDKKAIPSRSPDRRCSMELLAEQANLLDSLIRSENLSTTSLDLSKVGVTKGNKSKEKEIIESIKNIITSKPERSLQTTKSDHSLHDRVKSLSEAKEIRNFSKRRSLKKSSSGGNICRLDSITEFPKESVQYILPSIEESRLSVKNEAPKTKLKSKPKITSSVEVTQPTSPLKFKVENVTVEEKIREPKKGITFSAEVESPIILQNEEREENKISPVIEQENKSISVREDMDDNEPSNGNFWDLIGKRETIYLNKRKEKINDDIIKNRRAMYWYSEEEELCVNSENNVTEIEPSVIEPVPENNKNNSTSNEKDSIKDNNEFSDCISEENVIDKDITQLHNTNEPLVVLTNTPDQKIDTIEPLNLLHGKNNSELKETENIHIPLSKKDIRIVEIKDNANELIISDEIKVNNERVTNITESKEYTNNNTTAENKNNDKTVIKVPIELPLETANSRAKDDINTKIQKVTSKTNNFKVQTLPQKVVCDIEPNNKPGDTIHTKKAESKTREKNRGKFLDNNMPSTSKNEVINATLSKTHKSAATELSKPKEPSLKQNAKKINENEKCKESNETSCVDNVISSVIKTENIPDKTSDLCINSNIDKEITSKVGEENKAESVLNVAAMETNKEKEEAEKKDNDSTKCVKLPPTKKPVKQEAAIRPLIATPRPLQKKPPQVVHSSSSSESSSEEESSEDNEADESDASEGSTEFFECENNPDGRTSTGSNDSGFDSSAPTSPAGFVFIKKECDVNCHRKCEKLTANLCGVNQRLLVEALATRTASKRGGEPASASAGTSTASGGALDILEQELEASTAYGLFRKTGRFTPPARSIPRFRKYTIEDFHFIKVLGKGSFGKVLLAELRETEYYYAVKCLKKDVVLEDDDVECTLIERKVLALGTNHPYLCHLFATFQTDSHLFFVMEYLNGGDLMFHIQQSGRFPETRARLYAAEIVSGLKFLHKRGIVYRDLKLDNILLDYEGHVRIADFGMCKLQIYLDKTADTFCGTPDYMAPEIIKGLKYNQTVDWWSFGVLLYEMLIGQSPFSGCDEDELFWSICNEMPSYPRFLSQEALTVLTRLLDKDARTRLGGTECMHGDIRDQDFFHAIHWDKLERRELEAPFKPRVRHPLDTQYFDRAFTGERPRLTAVEPQVLRSMDQEPFRGFSYTNPNATDR